MTAANYSSKRHIARLKMLITTQTRDKKTSSDTEIEKQNKNQF